MANWKHQIKIADLLWGGDEFSGPDDATPYAHALADRVDFEIPRTDMWFDDELSAIIVDLRGDNITVDRFNRLLTRLYDWGDERHRLFVNIFQAGETEKTNAT